MPQARILRSAVKDLDEIWLYIALDNINAAERTIASLEAAANRLARNPGLGRMRDEFEVGLRSFPVGNYLIFYRKTARGIEVLHVYHGARNLDELFRTERD